MKRFYVILLALLTVVAVSCNGSKKSDKAGSRKVVMVSILPQRYFVEQIVGDKMAVECMLDKGGSPETYEPTFNAMTRLESSDIYFLIGNLGFETSLKGKIKDFNSEMKVVDTSAGVDLLKEEIDGAYVADPHTWTSVKNVKVMAKNIVDAICEMDTLNRSFYMENYQKFDAELVALDDSISNVLVDAKGRAFVVWHPALSYFSRDYGLEQIALEYEGKESPINYMQDKMDYARSRGSKVFLSQFDMDASKTDVVSNQLNIEKVIINPLGADWKNEILKIAHAIAK